MRTQEEIKHEYEQTLSAEQQLAIYLHNKMCKLNHTDHCSFNYEIQGIEHDWEGPAHAEYLLRAQQLLAITDDIDFIKKLINAIN